MARHRHHGIVLFLSISKLLYFVEGFAVASNPKAGFQSAPWTSDAEIVAVNTGIARTTVARLATRY